MIVTALVLIVVVAMMIFIEWKEIDPTRNQKNFRVFMSLLCIGVTLWILRACGVDIGNPFTLMQQFNPF